MEIKTVTLIGANGTMGKHIAAIFGAFGKAKVFMLCRTLEKAEEAKKFACKSIKCESLNQLLVPKEYKELEKCMSESDLIYEIVSEDFDLKYKINSEIAKYMTDTQICCTGTSGLAVSELSKPFSATQRKNYLGMHMSNPPYSLNMCELIPTCYTDKSLVAELKKYADTVLRRTSVVVKDEPGFLVNRVAFRVLNEMMQYADHYKDKGGVDYIDSIVGSFSGRTMPPIITADFAGLDVHRAIVSNIFDNSSKICWKDDFELPEYVNSLINQGYTGRKVGQGLYKTISNENGQKDKLVYDIQSNTYRPITKYEHEFAMQMIADLQIGNYHKAMQTLVKSNSLEAEICMECLLKYILYSLDSSLTIGEDIHSADKVIVSGFNWCPPLAMIEAFSGAEFVHGLILERVSKDLIDSIDLEKIFTKIESSKYDYRIYFKAKM